MSLTTKISFAIGLMLGVVVVLSIAVFRATDSSYVAQVVVPAEENLLSEPVISPIVQEVSVSASGAYTIDGGELYSFRADKRWPIASITKLMTAVVADKLYLSSSSTAEFEIIKITQEMVATEGNSGGLRAGETFRADDLIKAMMLVSSNDAGAALAMYYGEEAFVREMNTLARELGMTDTTFVDSTGLSVQNLSTIEDLRRLAKYVWEEQSYIFNISQRASDTIHDRTSGLGKRLVSINDFAGREDFLGGKTGSTPEAEGNLLSLFEVPGRAGPVVIIVLGTEDRFGETESILAEL